MTGHRPIVSNAMPALPCRTTPPTCASELEPSARGRLRRTAPGSRPPPPRWVPGGGPAPRAPPRRRPPATPPPPPAGPPGILPGRDPRGVQPTSRRVVFSAKTTQAPSLSGGSPCSRECSPPKSLDTAVQKGVKVLSGEMAVLAWRRAIGPPRGGSKSRSAYALARSDPSRWRKPGCRQERVASSPTLEGSCEKGVWASAYRLVTHL